MKLFKYLIVLSIAVLLGNIALNNSANISFNFSQISIEMPLWLGILLLLVITLLIYIIYNIFSNIGSLPKRIVNKRRDYAINKTQYGLLSLCQGNYSLAEKYLSQAAPLVNNPVINYVQAAIAAHNQQKYDKRDYYFSLAYQCKSKFVQLIQITQARLYIEAGEYHQSVELIQQLVDSGCKNSELLMLRIELAQQTKDWQQVINLLPKAYKSRCYAKEVLINIQKNAYIHILSSIANSEGRSGLLAIYKGIPKSIKNSPDLVLVFAKHLLELNLDTQAEQVLRTVLNKSWDSNLVNLYGLCKDNSNFQIKTAEKWLKKYPNDADLLLCLARLCKQQQLWGKSRKYFEASIELQPSPKSYAELGKLLNQLGDDLSAQKYYKMGLDNFVDVKSKLN